MYRDLVTGDEVRRSRRREAGRVEFREEWLM
jgi:hypothetical protein